MRDRLTKKDFRFQDTRLCFTLPATLGDRGRTPYERLNAPEDLVRWSSELGFSVSPALFGEDDLATTKCLREAIQRSGEALAMARPFNRKDLKTINAAAAAPPPVPRIAKDGHEIFWQTPDLRAVLSLVARDFIDLAAGPSSASVKICANPSCMGVFVDESRPQKRRWCSMQTCGNQMKKARLRIKERR